MKQHAQNSIFNELFVLEMANNHWGRMERGLKIISSFGQVVRFNNMRATIKLQFRDVESFIHRDFHARSDIWYVDKTIKTKLTRSNYRDLVSAVRENGCLASATPFDEASVDLCGELDLDVIKLASSDINDWFLIERIAELRKPVSFSTGGSSLKDMDDLVQFFSKRAIPFAINHCVSLYPTEDSQLELNQIDFLRNRYPHAVIGFSTHESNSWDASIMIAYSKGARTFERLIDIDMDGIPVSSYCSRPNQIESWFRAYNKAKEMSGGSGVERRSISEKETKYLDALVRGVYAKRSLPVGHVIHHSHILEDFYLAIPLQKGQLSCRELMNGEVLRNPVNKDSPLQIADIEGPYSASAELTARIFERGL